MSIDEEKIQMSLWAIAKAPLIFSVDLFSAPVDSINVLKNKLLIAINQDDLGQQAHCTISCGPSLDGHV